MLKEKEFYLANYGTKENIEIFKTYKESRNESINNKVYLAELDENSVWEENGVWNYEDNYQLIVSKPIEV